MFDSNRSAIAHGVRKLKDQGNQTLEKLLKRFYLARFTATGCHLEQGMVVILRHWTTHYDTWTTSEPCFMFWRCAFLCWLE